MSGEEKPPEEWQTVKNPRPVSRQALEEAGIEFIWHGHDFQVQEPISEDALQSLRNRTQEIIVERNEVKARRPTYIRVHQKYMSTITLDTFCLPWFFDPSDAQYLVIKRWLTPAFQDELFEHTMLIRELNRIDKHHLAVMTQPMKASSKYQCRSCQFINRKCRPLVGASGRCCTCVAIGAECRKFSCSAGSSAASSCETLISPKRHSRMSVIKDVAKRFWSAMLGLKKDDGKAVHQTKFIDGKSFD